MRNKPADLHFHPVLSVEFLDEAIDDALDQKRKISIDAMDVANELYMDFLTSDTLDVQIRFAMLVLKYDPLYTDCYLRLIDMTPATHNERLELLLRLQKLAEIRLGKDAVKKYKPHFYGFLETRPYMRIRYDIATTYMEMEQFGDAITVFQAMLSLSENDNLGVRYPLLCLQLAQSDLDGARRLLQSFEDEVDNSVVFAWGNLLSKFVEGDNEKAVIALERARNQNPYIEKYVSSRIRIPKFTGVGCDSGSTGEAVEYAALLRLAWSAHPAAMKWLSKQRVADA
jgi:tetratricopeptide (TPR) repeat protein